MLVKCPKCGFDQPKDTYCASCGIEMDNFKPIKPPFWKRVVKSPLFSLVLFLVFGYGALLYLKNPSQFQKPPASQINIEDYAEPAVIAETAPPSASPAPEPPPPAPQAEPAPNNATSASSIKMKEEAPPPPLPKMEVSEAPPKVEPKVEKSPEAPDSNQERINIESIKGPLALEIRFIEAPLGVIQRFHSEASENALGDTGEMAYAIVKNAAAWNNHPAFKELDRFTKKVPEVKKKLQWFSGTHEPGTGAPFGLDFQIALQDRNGGHLVGDLFISRSMIEHNDSATMTQRKEFSTRFETDVGSLIGLSGVMPRGVIFKAEDKDLLQDSLLKLFLSPAYQAGEAELLILLQFKSDTKSTW